MGEQKKQDKKKKDVSYLQFLKENKWVAALLGVVAVVLVGAGILIGVFAGRGAKPASSDVEEESSSVETESSAAAEDIPLEVDAYAEVNSLMAEYYQAVTDGNREDIKAVTDITDEESLLYLEMRSAYIESYNDLQYYTKAGPIENSYVVYASYSVKFVGVETEVPGISPFLIYPRDDGTLYIHEGEVAESVSDYLEEISVQDDVVDLMNEIQVKFNDTVANNEVVNNFLAQMKEELKVVVGEALAEAEAAQENEQQTVSAEALANGTQVKATAVVNVRKSDSEQADRVGKLQVGEELTLLESKANGWSKVSYNGVEAYVKSEYLIAADAPLENAGVDDENTTASGGTQSGTSLPTSGTIRVASTVNIRKSASETADKLAVCYQGEKLKIVMQQADGWTKVEYNGKTGYVKTAVLKVLE